MARPGPAGQASPYSEKGPSFLGKTAAAVEPHWEEGEDTQLQEVLQRSLARADEHGGAVPEAEADGNSRGNGGVGGGSRAKTRKEGWQEVVVLTSEGEDEASCLLPDQALQTIPYPLRRPPAPCNVLPPLQTFFSRAFLLPLSRITSCLCSRAGVSRGLKDSLARRTATTTTSSTSWTSRLT